jgi:hypothetical protein
MDEIMSIVTIISVSILAILATFAFLLAITVTAFRMLEAASNSVTDDDTLGSL